MALAVGGRLPDLEVADQNGKMVRLSDLKPGVIFVYPAADTPG